MSAPAIHAVATRTVNYFVRFPQQSCCGEVVIPKWIGAVTTNENSARATNDTNKEDTGWEALTALFEEADRDPFIAAKTKEIRQNWSANFGGLKRLRLAVGLSQQDLANRLNTQQSYVSRLEKGQVRNPGLDRLRQLAEILGVPSEAVLKALRDE